VSTFLVGDLINEFYAEYGSLSGETEAIDIDEMIASLAKVVADMTWSCDAMLCRHIVTSDNQHTGFVEPDTRAQCSSSPAIAAWP
jgi:hypothetical protein